VPGCASPDERHCERGEAISPVSRGAKKPLPPARESRKVSLRSHCQGFNGN